MTGRENNIMLGEYKGRLKLADNFLQLFGSTIFGKVVKDNIYFTIKGTITYKVMISGVMERKTGELELGTEEGEEAMSGRIIWIYIGISAEEVGNIRILHTNFLNMVPKVYKRGHKLILAARGRKIESCMDRGDYPR